MGEQHACVVVDVWDGTHGWCGAVDPMVGLAVRFDTVTAVAEGSDALLVGSMMPAMPAGGWL